MGSAIRAVTTAAARSRDFGSRTQRPDVKARAGPCPCHKLDGLEAPRGVVCDAVEAAEAIWCGTGRDELLINVDGSGAGGG